jgi:hypothetical protein
MKTMLFKSAALLIFLTSSTFLFSQKKMESPRDSVSGKIGKANIAINYGSPSVRGRKIWGDLVPYGKVWRAGANEATTFNTDQAITVEGKKLAAGRYSFFVIPGEKEWTVIFNKKANQWGAYEYKASDDALRVNVKIKKSANMQERLTYKIYKNSIALIWENTEAAVSIE